MAFDPLAPSCAGLVARTLGERFGWTSPGYLRDLITWADVIDAAAYPSAAAACALDGPAQRLALWVSANRDPAALVRYIDELSRGGLAEVDAAPWITPVLGPALARRAGDRDAWFRLGRRTGPTVAFDLVGTDLPAPGFNAYDLFSDCTYTVTLARTPTVVKVGVGHNPWGPGRRSHDLGSLCESYGGGGHAAVGGITLPADALDRGREITAAIVNLLSDEN